MPQQNNSETITLNARSLARHAVGELCTEWQAATTALPAAPLPPTLPENYDTRNIYHICSYGDLSALQALSALGVDFSPNADRALQLAAESGHADIVRFLVDHGADLHTQNDYALQIAASNGHTETVRYLIDHNANIHADNNLALLWAASSGHSAIVGLLLENGAKIHASNDMTLQKSAKNGHTETVRFLLERGADLHAMDDTALQWAAKNGQMETAHLLVELGAPPDKLPPLHRQAYEEYRQAQLAAHQKTTQTLADIFKAATWAGHVPEMIALWQQIPEPLRAGQDFQHLQAEATIHGMKQRKPKITLVK